MLASGGEFSLVVDDLAPQRWRFEISFETRNSVSFPVSDLDDREFKRTRARVRGLSRALSIATSLRHQSHPLSNTERRILNRAGAVRRLTVHAGLLLRAHRLARRRLVLPLHVRAGALFELSQSALGRTHLGEP